VGLKNSVRRLVGKPGTANLRKHAAVAAAAADHEQPYADCSDAELKTAFDGFRGDLDGRDRLAQFCALTREAANRAIGERPFDVQLQGALGILDGTVVEMATGEGKTLSGAIAALGMIARGRQVQIMTVNDYLAHRDATWMAPIYRLLGVESGWVTASADHEHRQQAYSADVCYGAITEIGFDLLRDRLRTDPDQIVQPEPDAAIIDEADSVMIDEAKVPLVLAGSMPGVEDGTTAADVVRQLSLDRDYESSPDGLQVNLTEDGIQHCEKLRSRRSLCRRQ
jgi:preprotein translocase subunit SecA